MVHSKGANAIIDPLGGAFVGASVKSLASGRHYVGYVMVAGQTGAYDIPSLLQSNGSIHGFPVFRLLQRPGLMDRMTEIGMKYAEKATPVQADNNSFNSAPEAYSALNRCRHFGKLTITV